MHKIVIATEPGGVGSEIYSKVRDAIHAALEDPGHQVPINALRDAGTGLLRSGSSQATRVIEILCRLAVLDLEQIIRNMDPAWRTFAHVPAGDKLDIQVDVDSRSRLFGWTRIAEIYMHIMPTGSGHYRSSTTPSVSISRTPIISDMTG